ncbi:glycosyltransferase family 4 protein [Motilimonas sp. 1_MG-2023]|uniref:glycosyltransferase family 4 protein n=1 Tax=Motilimonas sp. 1_MG-2023 TaxID=3062672 RepID=UPI0026E41089|nr:glycosyltransferase family 4 protein [Motilimonas sp. 1_MG-2023]MDO6527443.1 glycosyltransferase family 4 protein [Motilimonas sp. 1_MG-2023]
MMLVVNLATVFGGQERYADDLLTTLASLGHDVYFIGGPEKLTRYSEPQVDADVRVLNGNSALYKYALKPFNGELTVYVQHSNINDGQQACWRRWVRKCLLKLLLYKVDLVVRVCDNALPEYYAPGKVVTIYNGVSLPDLPTICSITPSVRLLMVGAVNANKNQRLAIDVLTLLPQAHLTLLGDGPEMASLQTYAKTLGVESRIEWVGFVEDPSPYYQQADLLLMLSHFEAFPYSVLESMAYATPVIAVGVGGVPEIIQNNKNGWLLPDYCVETLSEQIIRIVNKPNEYAQVASAARATIAQGFTKEKMVNSLLTEIKNRKK